MPRMQVEFMLHDRYVGIGQNVNHIFVCVCVGCACACVCVRVCVCACVRACVHVCAQMIVPLSPLSKVADATAVFKYCYMYSYRR